MKQLFHQKNVIRLLPSSTAAIVDSGTTGHYLTATPPCGQKQFFSVLLPIKMPNGEIIHSTHTTLIPHKNLPIEARKAPVFPGLTNRTLLSIGTLCDNEYIVVFDDTCVRIINKTTHKILMKGGRDIKTGLYILELEINNEIMEATVPDNLFANSIYECKSKQNLVMCLHQACWSQ